MNGIKYNILVVDDDPIVLEDSVLMYNEMIRFGDFNGIFGKDSSGTVSAARNSREAEEILKKNIASNPKLIEILHVDERMPDERGSEFVSRMRWIYAGRRIGALLVTGYSTDVSVINSRESGVYRYISKPITPDVIKPHIEDLVKVIFSKEKPRKLEVTDKYIFKQIENKQELLYYFQLRYNVFEFMNYLQQRNDKRLDIDKFDPYSIPFGGFLVNRDGSETIVATIRIVTPMIQIQYHDLIKSILQNNETSVRLVDTTINQHNVKTLSDFVNLPKYGAFPVVEAFKVNSLIAEYEKSGITYGEYSRIIDHPDHRGFGLSKMAILTALAYCKLNNGPQMIFGACVPQHVPMYEKYGWYCIDGLGPALEKKVQQVAYTMVCDVLNDIQQEYEGVLEEHILPQLTNQKKIYYPFK